MVIETTFGTDTPVELDELRAGSPAFEQPLHTGPFLWSLGSSCPITLQACTLHNVSVVRRSRR